MHGCVHGPLAINLTAGRYNYEMDSIILEERYIGSRLAALSACSFLSQSSTS
eukprot:COSAG02_NODE_3625_length_6453_cov_4.201448_6_plen_52_part_00